MSLQGYLNSNVLATISESTTTNTLTSIDVFNPTMTTAKAGETVLIVHKGTGREYPITLSNDLESSSNKVRFTSATFDTLIPEGSIVIQSNLAKWDTIFREYTTVNIPMVVRKNNSTNNLLRDSMITAIFDEDAGSVLSDGDSVDADFSSLHSSFLTPSNGAKIENIKYTLNTTSATGRNCTLSLFELPIAVNSNSSQTISLIEEQSFTSQNDATYNFYRSNNIAHTLAANTCIMPTFKATGSVSNSDAFIANIEILISFDPR